MPALADDVYESIKALLMDNQIAPGARLTIDGLARDLKVSQTPVREALAALEADGLTVKEYNRSYRATELITFAEFEDLYEFRMQVEPWAAARAAARASDEQLTRLRHILDDLPPAPHDGHYHDYRTFSENDQVFHRHIQVASGNSALPIAFDRLHVHLQMFRLYYGSGIGTEAQREHQAISRAIVARDEDAAAEAMRTHLTESRNRLLPVLTARALPAGAARASSSPPSPTPASPSTSNSAAHRKAPA